MSSQIDQYVSVYREVSSIPSILSAIILEQAENVLNILSNWSVSDLTNMEKTGFTRNYIYNLENSQVLFAGRPYDISSVCRQTFSNSGKKQAILREKKKNSNDNCDLEIWNEIGKEKTIDLADIEDHGKVNSNAFGCLAWSSDEKHLLYTAEAKRPKSLSYFKASEKDGKNKGDEYIYREEWGEDFVGSHHSVLIILDVTNSKTEVVSIDEPEGISIGESVWGPGDKTVVFVGYKEFPRRLGVRSCTNRRSAIYVYDRETKKTERISGEYDTSVRYPCFSPDFKSLIYLENEIGGPHFKGSSLQKIDWETKKISTVVTTVMRPKVEEFPGLYVTSTFPKKCWYKENQVFLTSQWRSYVKILCINIDNGKVTKIDPEIKRLPQGDGKSLKDEKFGSCKVLSVHKNVIIAELSAINIEPCLALGCIQNDNVEDIKWKYLDSNAPVKHKEVKWEVLKLNHIHKDLISEIDYEVIYIAPKIDPPYPNSSAIIRPHGGPHSAFSAGFCKQWLAFSKLNYYQVLVNYRGSVGFGERFIELIPGEVGKHDVSDCLYCCTWLRDLPFKIRDIYLIGGSHGGFVGAHLVGQWPADFSAVVLLNPVIDMAGMSGTTDIPDWNYVEAGCEEQFDLTKVATPEILNTMWEKSPIKYAENICSPVLLLLGSKDLRVPYSQGLKLYHLLKARKVPVSIHVYEDNHSLGKTPHVADAFMQTVLWFEKHNQNKPQ